MIEHQKSYFCQNIIWLILSILGPISTWNISCSAGKAALAGAGPDQFSAKVVIFTWLFLKVWEESRNNGPISS